MQKNHLRNIIIILIILLCLIFVLCLKKDQPKKQQLSNGVKNCALVEIKECNKYWKYCKTQNIYKYAENGYKYEYYSPHRSWIDTFEQGALYPEIRVYNKNNKKILEYLHCDKNWKNCQNINKYDYDKNNNLMREYERCNLDSTNCKRITIFKYDKFNNITEKSTICDKDNIAGIYCGKSHKYVYDKNHNVIKRYHLCDEDFSSCLVVENNVYNNHNNIIKTTEQWSNGIRYYTYFYRNNKGKQPIKISCRNQDGTDCFASYPYFYNSKEKKDYTFSFYEKSNSDKLTDEKYCINFKCKPVMIRKTYEKQQYLIYIYGCK